MDVNLIPLLPATQVLLTALVVMLLDLFIKEPGKGLLAWISLLGLALGAGETVLLWGSQESAFGDTLLLDNFALFFAQIFVGVAALTILSSSSRPIGRCISSPGRCCCSSASLSKSARCRFISGCRTSTKARRRRSRDLCRWPSRPRPLPVGRASCCTSSRL